MKKYIAPSLKVVMIENTEILAASTKFGIDPTAGPVNVMEARGRRGGYIEDDFAEDFE